MEILDVAGRRVAVRGLGSLPAGPHALEWNLGHRIGPGVHVVRLRFGDEVRSARAVTLH